MKGDRRAVHAAFRSDFWFHAVNYVVLTIGFLLVLYPLYFVVIASFSDPRAVSSGRVWLVPLDVTGEGYRRIFRDPMILIGYRNTIIYTVGGTALNLLFTLTAGYVLSRPSLVGRALLMKLIVFTMLFSGGLIPRYLVIRQLGMLNTAWAMMIPQLVSVMNLIIARTFFQFTIPNELHEAAVMDGCGQTRFFVSVAVPLSGALISVMTLFYGVAHWNRFFDALVFLRSPDRYPLQLVLRSILIQAEVSSEMMGEDPESLADQARAAELIKYGMIIVSSVPFLALYPFLQKYFVKGVMIGAIKG
ncbi:MAG: carbohydrate ABC transporter permease [Spirochaetaceae bacterium]|nr:MAG: carbohydrate ABC transporter permease [Spirochaetaceae bacterium]